MLTARKDLKRLGLRSYIITGPKASFVIVRARPWRYLVRHAHMPARYDDFFALKFPRLAAARAFAEREAGLGA